MNPKNIEIERKFLINKVPGNWEGYKSVEIAQVYISVKPTIRLRKAGKNYFLTVKGSGSLSRQEFELSITKKEYDSLYLKKDEKSKPVKKTRYIIPIAGSKLKIELDEYHGELSGLYTAEVEFESEEEARGFTPPDWFGTEVTGNPSYSNAALSFNGLP